MPPRNARLRAFAAVSSSRCNCWETIVDTTRADTKTLALSRERFELRPLIDETVIDARNMLAQSRGVAIVLDSSLAAEELDGDRERLAAALWLMLTFAVEASAQGSTVTLETNADSSAWHAVATFDVAPAALVDAALPHLLEAFARKEACAPREAGRIAWVLALCKRVAEAHEGVFEQRDGVDGQPSMLTLRVPRVVR